MAEIKNQATLSYNGRSTKSNIVTGNRSELLTIEKEPLVDVYGIGENVTYLVTITSRSRNVITDVTLHDDLGKSIFHHVKMNYVPDSLRVLVNGIPVVLTPSTDDNGLTIGTFFIPPMANVHILYEARINEHAPLNASGKIDNTVTLNGSASNITAEATATIKPRAEADLTIGKAISPFNMTENDFVTYTFTILNHGNTAAAAKSVTVTDVFTTPLSDIVVRVDDEATTDYTYEGGVFTITPDKAVPAASYSYDSAGDSYTVEPGVVKITVRGRI